MDSRPGDEMLPRAVAERDMGAFRTLNERHAGRLAVLFTTPADGPCWPCAATVERRRAHSMIVSPNAHWCSAELLAVVGQLSTPVPALCEVI